MISFVVNCRGEVPCNRSRILSDLRMSLSFMINHFFQYCLSHNLDGCRLIETLCLKRGPEILVHNHLNHILGVLVKRCQKNVMSPYRLSNPLSLLLFSCGKRAHSLVQRRHACTTSLFNRRWLMTNNDVRPRDPPANVLHLRRVEVCGFLNSQIWVYNRD